MSPHAVEEVTFAVHKRGGVRSAAGAEVRRDQSSDSLPELRKAKQLAVGRPTTRRQQRIYSPLYATAPAPTRATTVLPILRRHAATARMSLARLTPKVSHQAQHLLQRLTLYDGVAHNRLQYHP